MAKGTIQTFIFFDLETTDLPRGNCLPNITEISMVAVSRTDLLSCMNTKTLPRVLHKLLLPINPLVPIAQGAKRITRLSNEVLANVSPFNNHVYSIINNFLSNLPGPICLLAHNGNRFDFPILLKELKSIDQVLNNDILIIDTWIMFKEYHNHSQKLVDDLLNDGCNEMLLKAAEDADLQELKELEEKVERAVISSSCGTSSSQSKYAQIQQKNNEKTPESQILKIKKRKRTCENNNVRRSLNFGKKQPPRVSYSLPDIYKRMFQTDPDSAHTAEGDCLTLLLCVSQISEYVITWADEHSVSLNSHHSK